MLQRLVLVLMLVLPMQHQCRPVLGQIGRLVLRLWQRLVLRGRLIRLHWLLGIVTTSRLSRGSRSVSIHD